MCGIVGLFCKRAALEPRLGGTSPPCSSSWRIAARTAPASPSTATRRPTAGASSPSPRPSRSSTGTAWRQRRTPGSAARGGPARAPATRCCWSRRRPRTPRRGSAAGGPACTCGAPARAIEIYKDVGRPRAFAERFGIADFRGSHGLGHTRMATESRVTTEGSHPFSTGHDLCLVHNGSLSNHNRLRERLRREGISFQTENDTEVAAGYLDLAPAGGRAARAGARGLPRRSRRLLHVPRRHRRRLRRPARPDRLQAGRARRDRRLGGDGVRVPRDRGPARRRPTRVHLGARAGRRLRAGRRRGRHDDPDAKVPPPSSTSRRRACAS